MNATIGHKVRYDGSPATSVRKADFVVKVVVLEYCEKTLCLIPEIADIVNSGQTQRKYKSGGAERKLRVKQEKRDEQIKKKMPRLLTWVWDKLDLITLNVRTKKPSLDKNEWGITKPK